MSHDSIITFQIQKGDITSVKADVVALKFAQGFHGADAAVARALEIEIGLPKEALIVPSGHHILVEAQGAIGAPRVLYVGLPPLWGLGYSEIRDFSRKVLEIIAAEAPQTKTLAMTLHGVNMGLDLVECAEEQLDGIRDALRQGNYPSALRTILIVDINSDRVDLITDALDKVFAGERPPAGWEKRKNTWPLLAAGARRGEVKGATQAAGRSIKPWPEPAAEKRSVFVAMPFAKEMRDVWKFGIYHPVRKAGLLCERIDEEAFVGDIIERMKKRIEDAALVIADLTGDNPNVFFELGYALGKQRRAMLLRKAPDKKKKKDEQLPFDVRTEKCLIYEDASDLEQKLTNELKGLGLYKKARSKRAANEK